MQADKILSLTETNLFMKHCKIKSRSADDGTLEAYFTVEDIHRNPYGYIHGGLLLTLADITAGMNARAYAMHPVTLNSDFHFIANVNSGEVVARAHVISPGTHIVVMGVRIFGEKNRLLGEGTFSFYNNRNIQYTYEIDEEQSW